MHAHPGKGMKSLLVAAQNKVLKVSPATNKPHKRCIAGWLFHCDMLANYFVRRTTMNF